MLKIRKKNSGYTLLETVVYVGIFSLVIVTVFGILFSFSKSFAYTKAYNEIRVSGETAMERIVREIRNASSVDMVQSAFDVNNGILILNTLDELSLPKTVGFYIDTDQNTLNFEDNLFDKGPLTGKGVKVVSVVFRKMDTKKGALIKIEMTLQSKKVITMQETFYDSIVLRGSY